MFNAFIAILSVVPYGGNQSWSVLKHRTLAPRNYVDAAWSVGRIFAVTSHDGSVLVWEHDAYG